MTRTEVIAAAADTLKAMQESHMRLASVLEDVVAAMEFDLEAGESPGTVLAAGLDAALKAGHEKLKPDDTDELLRVLDVFVKARGLR